MSDGHDAHDSHDGHHGHGGVHIQIPWRIVIPITLLAVPLTIYFAPSAAALAATSIGFLSPLWLPYVLVRFGFPLWLTFVRSHYVGNIPYATVELVPGPETSRSAQAMELVFYALHHRTEVTPLSAYLLGHIRVPWSFEVWAHNGKVRFFIHLPLAHRDAMETRIRAEYRDITIKDVEDYARTIPFDHHRSRLMMREFELKKPDPYPLKTYTAYEAASPKQDVFAELLETMLSAGEKEHLCFSLLVRPHQRERGLFEEESVDSLHVAAQREIKKLLGSKGDVQAASAHVKKSVAGIEAALKKPSFDCGARVIYVADRNTFVEDAEEHLTRFLEKFEDEDLNGFVAYDPGERLGWLVSQFSAVAPSFKELYLLHLYRRRAFFAPPYYGKPFVLNTEELATLFHLPYYQRASPLSAVRGIRLEPPANLPM